MAEWFLIAAVGARLIYAGPFTEHDCQMVKKHLMTGVEARCVERRMLDGSRPT